MPFDTVTKQFTCIYIPCDPSRNIEHQIVQIHEGKIIECMINHVKLQIDESEKSRKAQLTRDALQAERAIVGGQLAEQIKKNPQLKDVKLTDDLIDRIYLSNAVDSIPLIPHCIATNFVGVQMYVDDQGMGKRLPRNHRATQILFSCGQQMEVLGDAWIARVLDDNDDNFARLDIDMTYLSSPRFLTISRAFASQAIKQTMAHEAICKLLHLEPEPSLIPTINKPKIEIVEDDEKDTTKKDEQNPEKTNEDDADKPSREIQAAYNKENQALSDTQGMCARGFVICYKDAKLRCARCRAIFYCCAEHQKIDWKRHKLECKPIPKAEAPATTTTEKKDEEPVKKEEETKQ